MTTVGYGELSPLSETGKYVSVLAAFMGVGFQALVVIGAHRNFVMTNSEEVSYTLLDIIQLKQSLKELTGQLLSTTFKWK